MPIKWKVVLLIWRIDADHMELTLSHPESVSSLGNSIWVLEAQGPYRHNPNFGLEILMDFNGF